MSLKKNRMSRIADKTQCLPKTIRTLVLSRIFGRIVPFLATSGLRFDEVGAHKMVVSLRNSRRVQNHIKGVHAAAMALLAETSTGFVVAMSMPDDKLMLLKSMTVHYLRRSQGDMRAEAVLSAEQIERFYREDKGDVTVSVRVSDESGEEPIHCEMVWAWLPKKRD
jgi:acyl-coenzyme A thioesterase PaaI-like protein